MFLNKFLSICPFCAIKNVGPQVFMWAPSFHFLGAQLAPIKNWLVCIPDLGFPIRSDTNQTVQSQNKTKSLKFWI